VNIAPCKICGNEDFDFLFDGKDRMHYLPGSFKLYQCRKCRLIFLYPPLTGKALEQYYPKDYYSYDNSRRAEPVKSRRQKIFHFLKHPIEACNCLLYSKFLDLNRPLDTPRDCRLLDVGCGDGRFLLEKFESGCFCFGNDISRAALDRLHSRQPAIETRCGDLWDVNYPDDFFDVINMSHVIEHVPDVNRLLAEAHRVLKKGGVLRIQVPNAASFTFMIFRKYWMPLEVPRHVYAFSVQNLKTLFKKTGFDVVCSRTAEGSFTFFASIIFVLGAFFRRKIDFMQCERIWNSEILKMLFFPYAWFVNTLHRGDTAEFLLTKT